MMHTAYSPYFHKIYKFPKNSYIPSLFQQTFFAIPYFDQDAFMHHALYVAYWTPLFPPILTRRDGLCPRRSSFFTSP